MNGMSVEFTYCNSFYYPTLTTSKYTVLNAPKRFKSTAYMRIKASAMAWPPFTVSGLLIEFVTTSACIPRSMRWPFVCLLCFTVTLNNGIVVIAVWVKRY